MNKVTGQRPLRVCYFGTYRDKYPRNQILINGLRMQGVIVYECHAKLWQGIKDRVQIASGGWVKPVFWLRILKAYWHLLWKHTRIPEYDVMLIGYPGQFDTFLGRVLSWWRRRPMVLDVLMSLYLVAEERGLTRKSPGTARIIFWLEKTGLHLPELLITENSVYEAYVRQKYSLPADRFQHVPHGADERIYHPRSVYPPADCFRVTYHGMYLPSHGLDVIIKAAILLRDQKAIAFHFYGDGPERARIEAIANEKQLNNVSFHGFVDREELLNGIARSHICLGVFGSTRQSYSTIQNKVWEGLAMGRAVISGDSLTLREALTHKEHIFLIKREDASALAKAILTLKEDASLRERIAKNGYARFIQGNAIPAVGAATERALRSIL